MTLATVDLIHDPDFRRQAATSFAKGLVFVTIFFILLFGWMMYRAEQTIAQWQERFPSKTITLEPIETLTKRPGSLSESDMATPDDAPVSLNIPDESNLPFTRYRKFVSLLPGKTRLAIVLSDMGVAQSLADMAFDKMHPDVTFGFSPYAGQLTTLKEAANKKKFETWLMLPLEPSDMPTQDSGPMTVMTDDSLDMVQDHVSRLTQLGESGYPGFITHAGHVFHETDLRTNPMMRMIAEKGFGFAEGRSEGGAFAKDYAQENGVPYVQAGEWLTRNMDRADIQAILQRLEKLSQMNGSAVLMVEPTPLSISMITEWTAKLPGRNIQLVPLSAVAE